MASRPRADPQPTLAQLYEAHEGLASDKWVSYFDAYEEEIGPMRACGPLRLLEIGVQNGGSLELWKTYLPPGSEVVGVDIDARCLRLPFSPGVVFVHGDATQAETMARLPAGDFDVIIDDGSHRPEDVHRSFELLFPRLAPGGKYVIEDVHTSYWPDVAGGFLRPGTAVEWSKLLIDAINGHHVQAHDQTVIPDWPVLRDLGRRLRGVAFYDSLIVLKAAAEPRTSPPKRMLAGGVLMVQRLAPLLEAMPPEQLDEWRFNPAAERYLRAHAHAEAAEGDEI